ncbi:MAG: squalene/phytoene synthase family protein [Gammaproteobacteria bacterium]
MARSPTLRQCSPGSTASPWKVNPIDYCWERVAVPGSSCYYSTLWLGPEVQRGLYALLAFKDAIAEIPRTCTDPAVAGMKLAFWREELARIEAGEPARHPIAELMAWVARTYGLEPRGLGPTLAATERMWVPAAMPATRCWYAISRRCAAPIWRGCARIHGYRDETIAGGGRGPRCRHRAGGAGSRPAGRHCARPDPHPAGHPDTPWRAGRGAP